MTLAISNMRPICHLVMVTLAVSFLTASCGEKEKPKSEITPDIKIDAMLNDVSQMAALVRLNMKVQKTTNCITADSLDKTDLPKNNSDKLDSGTDVYVNRIIGEIASSYKNHCSLFIEVEKTTGPVFERIKKEGKLPSDLYVFSIFSKTSDGNMDDRIFKEQEVGLFDSLASCKVIEIIAHEKNIPVQKCRKWEDIVKVLKKSTN